jgi:transcriptional regulator with XRE-family HTH domain
LLGWSQDGLAAKSGLSKPTIARLEIADRDLSGCADSRGKITAALAKAGVVFIDEGGDSPGVRLRKTKRR